jgi:solute carrier family 25 S-adenosylmethionine transporter 26
MSDVTERRGRKFAVRLNLAAIPGLGPKPGRKRPAPTFASASVASSSAAATAKATVKAKPVTDVVAGALARAASQSTIHPLDTFKVRLQTGRAGAVGVSKFGKLVPPAGGFDFASFGRAVGSLYKGVFGAASGAGIAIGTYFAFYGAACNLISRNSDMPPGAVAFAAGGIAAAGSSVVKVPLAVCIRSVQAGVYPNVFAAARSIVAAAGPRGLFTGYAPTLLEDVPDMAIKFAAYESMRSLYRRLNGGEAPSMQADFAMGAGAGALAAAATTPLDVVKTTMMCAAASRPTMRGAARQVMASGGARAFLTGVGPRALSNGINSAVFFAFFEAFKGFIADAKTIPLSVQLLPPGSEDESEPGPAGCKMVVQALAE